MHKCELDGADLISYDEEKYPNEEIEQYDPEGFRGNYECPVCHSVYGCTKSSLTIIVDSIYASQFADTMTLTESNYLWSKFQIRTREQLIGAARMGDHVALKVLVERLKSAERLAESKQGAVKSVNRLVECIEEAEAKGRDKVYYRGVEHSIKDLRYFLMLIFWEKKQ